MTHEHLTTTLKTPKHIRIAELLREEIIRGRMPVGTQLPPDSKLAELYGVNNRTIANGMAVLVGEGLISRSPKRGTVVINTSPQQRVSNAVGVFMYDSGKIAHELSKALLQRGLYPIWVNQLVYGHMVMSPNYKEPVKRLMKKLLEDNPYGFIIEGERFMPYDFLQRNLPRLKRLAIIRFNLSTFKIPGAKYSLIDCAGIGRAAAKYLIDRGHRKLTFIAHAEALPAPDYPPTSQELMIEGMSSYCRQAGAKFIDEIPQALMRGNSFEEIASRYFAHESRPTGCLLAQDSLWHTGLGAALEQHSIRCPQDISVIGCYNTEWATKSHPHLSSIDTYDQLIVRRGVELLTEENTKEEYFAPFSIVERDSVRSL